jgi:hypothetical protein
VAVLGLPVLYAAHQPELEHLLPEDMLLSIRQAYTAIHPDDFHEDWNPVIRVPLVVSRVENQLVIDEMRVAQPDGAPGPAVDADQQQQVMQPCAGTAGALCSDASMPESNPCLQAGGAGNEGV